MKKIISVILAAIMIFTIGSVAAFAEDTSYEITFADCPYDVAPFRSDYIGKYVGYQYGVDYWYTVTNEDGTTTDIKGYPESITVDAGETLEFTVSLADYIEPASLKVLAYPTGTAPFALHDEITGEPHAPYYVAISSAGTYGIKPQEDMTICVSEYHLYNDCFMFDFPMSTYYSTKRLQYNAGAYTPEEMYTEFEWDNTKVVYLNETVYFKVVLPIDGEHDYHYDTYQVYYTKGFGSEMETIYLKQNASEENGTEAIDLRVAHYETETEWVDIYAIPDVDASLQLKVVNTVTYTLDMLEEFFNDFSLENIDDIDFSSLDVAPLFEFFVRLLNLIVKILRGFGLEIDISSLIG